MVSNQEIVVRFDSQSVSVTEAQLAVSKITNQLKSIGVAYVQVSELHDGKLKVTYYSTIDVAVIKELLGKQNNLQLGKTGFDSTDSPFEIPFNGDPKTYKLDVVLIQKDNGSNVGLQGLPMVVKSSKDYLKPIFFQNVSENNLNLGICDESKAFKIHHNFSLSMDNPSHIFPEVRAGPVC